MVVAHYIEQWNSKSLHGQWTKLLHESNVNSSAWLQTAPLKLVTEALIIAAQDQVLCTNWLGYHILRTVHSDHCRKCGQFAESIEHIVAGCPLMAQLVYLDQHNAIASAIHCGSCSFPRSHNWWQHHPEPVIENEDYKLLYCMI